MIGTGVFTSLGMQLKELHSAGNIILLWLFGGVFALCGAMSYAEVGTYVKKSGGEYSFLSKLYGPLTGFISGWISMTVGFAAPIALSAIAFTEYLPFSAGNAKFFGFVILAIITLVHSFNLNVSEKFQNYATLLKILLITIFIIVGIFVPADYACKNNFNLKEILSPAFIIAFIYVTYSYSGWNAAAYIAEEFREPRKALPRALIGGTLIVTIMYLLLQLTFLRHSSPAEITGKINVGAVVMQNMLGGKSAFYFSLGISALLLSGISAMIWVGARVSSTIANDFPGWFILKSKGEIPRKALLLQLFLSSVILFSGTFEQIMIYCGVQLTLCSSLVVLGIFKLRRKKKNMTDTENHFKSPFFPLLQIIFLAASAAILFVGITHAPKESFLGLANILIAIITYYISKNRKL